MPVTFPSNPTNGQTVIYGSLRYTYFSDKQYWKTTKVLNIASKTTFTTSTAVLNSNQDTTLSLSAYTGYVITGVTVSTSSWVRLYSGNQKMLDDSSRLITEDPNINSGIGVELITENSGTFSITPGIYVVNSDTPITNTAYLRVTNLSQTATTTTISLDLIQIGA